MMPRSVPLALLLAMAASVGCASRSAPPHAAPRILAIEDRPPDPTRARTGLALPSQEILDYEASPDGTFAIDRFEFGRRDAAVSASSRIPLRATNQWPEPSRPAERPVRFNRWQQR